MKGLKKQMFIKINNPLIFNQLAFNVTLHFA